MRCIELGMANGRQEISGVSDRQACATAFATQAQRIVADNECTLFAAALISGG